MIAIVDSLVTFVVGIVLAYVFFGGLWLTVQRLPDSRHPAFLAVASMFGRLALTAAGFYLVARGDWVRLLIAFAGFMVAKFVLVSRLGEIDDKGRRADADGDSKS